MNRASDATYSDAFFDKLAGSALDSARIVVPMIVERFSPRSVIDVGCGTGAWLHVFRENGVETTRGIDGDYVDQAKLLVEASDFEAVDLSRPFRLTGRYDLAVCLEVGEHLPASMSAQLVSNLVAVSDLVLFSAAIPGQGGVYHINERWPHYWEELFARHAYRKLDPFRPLIWQDTRIPLWYRQNLVVYASEPSISASSSLAEAVKRARESRLELVSTDILRDLDTLSSVLKQVPALARRAISKRWSRLRGSPARP